MKEQISYIKNQTRITKNEGLNKEQKFQQKNEGEVMKVKIPPTIPNESEGVKIKIKVKTPAEK